MNTDTKNNESIKEYGVFKFDIKDTLHKEQKRMKTLIFTTNQLDKLKSYDEQVKLSPSYYLPFYINIFNTKLKQIKEIKNVKETDLKQLFIKEFNDFITITLKQELSPKVCMNFIKDKVLVEKFITEYKSKNPSFLKDTTPSYDPNKYKIFMENVYVFLIKFILTPAGSFIYKPPQSTSDNDETLEGLYYLENTKLTNHNVYEQINNFLKKETDKEPEKKTKDVLEITNEISLSTIRLSEIKSITKTILDNIFKQREEKILKEKSYDYLDELNYNKFLKNFILEKINDEDRKPIPLYRLNGSYKKDFDSNDLKFNETVKVFAAELNKNIVAFFETKTNANLNKNKIEMTDDIDKILLTYYFEKEKTREKRQKKIDITIIFNNDYKPTISPKVSYEGIPTFADITKFQKQLQEQVSKYIKSCKDPVETQVNIKNECLKICKSSNKNNTTNKLWCDICTNYIRCVYNDPTYDAKTEAIEKKVEKVESNWKKLVLGKINAADKPPPKPPAKPPAKLPAAAAAAAAAADAKPPDAKPPDAPPKARAARAPPKPRAPARALPNAMIPDGVSVVVGGINKTISKKQLFKPHNSKKSFKLIKIN